MQNKANLLDTQMNASHVKTKTYEQKTMNCEPTKQTQSKPIYGEHSRTIYGEPACLEPVERPALQSPELVEGSLVEVSNHQSQFPGHWRRRPAEAAKKYHGQLRC